MMKFTILLVLAISFQSFAKGYGQENISLNLEKATLKQVLKSIEQQGVYRFVYKDELLSRSQRVNISVKDASLDEVLDRVLKNTELSYRKLNGNLVVITSGSENNAAAELFRLLEKITSDKGEALSGVSVVEKGTNNGTTTNAEGNYMLNVANGSATLQITYISGYTSQEIAVNDRSTINVTIVADNKNLEEVIVVGYGTQKKKKRNGSDFKCKSN
ncbi:MAG: carboxypeptidase-like regulatory domain-containing protein [Chitinophagaceae bacterium]|nr:carboxypeptidase-like regulatory domain-containing protein [Chitinophagaceae bacterium]